MTVSTLPYLHDKNDVDAVVTSIDNLRKALATDPAIKFLYPAENQTSRDFVNTVCIRQLVLSWTRLTSLQYPISTSTRSANHWMGSCKMGTDSGLTNGTAVVDTNAQGKFTSIAPTVDSSLTMMAVYGTDSLFVVDASIFPGMTTTNPSALIVSVAEHASEKILALGCTQVV